MQSVTSLSEGDAAYRLLADPSFEAEWRSLYRGCAWATVFQGIDFSRVWYDVYREQFAPVIVSMQDAEGRLCGLLTLAVNRRTSALVHAGHFLAEYQVWIATPDMADRFIREALGRLARRWPRQALMLRYIPPGTPMTWLDAAPELRRKCRVLPFTRPLVGASEDDVNRALKSRTKQRGMKGLAALGAVSFEKVGRDEFAELFERAWPIYEFRQIGKYNCTRFLSDPALGNFYRALASRTDVLHMTVTRVDETVVAWLMGVCSEGYFHPLAFAHSPFHAKHSPGGIHILKVAQMLMRDEGRVFDLTPGGDAYKDLMASGHEATHVLYFYPGVVSFAAYPRNRELAKMAVKKLVRMALGRTAPNATEKPAPSAADDAARVKNALQVCALSEFARPAASDIAQNRIRDLLHYAPVRGEPALQDFLLDAQRHIDLGADVFTCVRDNRLLASCWIVTRETVTADEKFFADAPPGVSLLLAFYAHPSADADDLFRRCIAQWRDAVTRSGAPAPVRLGVNARDAGVCARRLGEV